MFTVRITAWARADIDRLIDFLAEKDIASAERCGEAIERSLRALEHFPYSCRSADPDDPLLRELIIPFGNSGYVALFRILASEVRVLAIRHQLEEDYQ